MSSSEYYHPHSLGTPCVDSCRTPTPPAIFTYPGETIRPEHELLSGIAERVERKQGRLTLRFYSGWWHARMAFYDENGQWQLATGLGKILIEALTECLADAEKLEKL